MPESGVDDVPLPINVPKVNRNTYGRTLVWNVSVPYQSANSSKYVLAKPIVSHTQRKSKKTSKSSSIRSQSNKDEILVADFIEEVFWNVENSDISKRNITLLK